METYKTPKKIVDFILSKQDDRIIEPVKGGGDFIAKELSQSLENVKCMNKAFAWLEQAMGLDINKTKTTKRCRDDSRKDSPL